MLPDSLRQSCSKLLYPSVYGFVYRAVYRIRCAVLPGGGSGQRSPLDRIPKGLREKMRRYKIDWASEIRRFIEERVRSLELLEVLGEVGERAQSRRTRVDSTVLIREERERR